MAVNGTNSSKQPAFTVRPLCHHWHEVLSLSHWNILLFCSQPDGLQLLRMTGVKILSFCLGGVRGQPRTFQWCGWSCTVSVWLKVKLFGFRWTRLVEYLSNLDKPGLILWFYQVSFWKCMVCCHSWYQYLWHLYLKIWSVNCMICHLIFL
jgi:hypothetical protein